MWKPTAGKKPIRFWKVWRSFQEKVSNTAVRNYCSQNNKILYDIADIECHDTDGNKITENGYEVLWTNYTTDDDDGSTDVGHLNDVNDVARQRAAKAMWVLLCQIAE